MSSVYGRLAAIRDYWVLRDDIIRMAREAGIKDHGNPEMWGYMIVNGEEVEHFAALVAAAEQDRCCGLIFSWAGSDNVAQRTVDAIRGKV